MKWQLAQHGWPVDGGRHYVPTGTIITDDFRWADTGIALPPPMPINARALDQEAWEQMCAWYPQQLHLIQYDPHTVRPNQPQRRRA
jgi:hypothetical protein